MTTIPATLHGPNPLPPSAGLASSNATLTDVLGMIRRRLLSIIFLFVVFGSMACGGFYVWWVYLPTYSAVGLIECVTSVPRESLAIADERLPDREHERFVLTQVQMVESPNVINAVLASDDVRNTKWFQEIPARKSAFDELIEQLTVQPVRGTNHMSISMATRHRADARPIVEQVMQQYLESVETRSADRFRDDLDIASGELTRARASLQAKREQLKALAERLPGGLAVGRAGAAAQEARLYSQQVAELSLDLARLEQLRQYYEEGGAVGVEGFAAVEADPTVRRLVAELSRLEQQKAVAAQTFGSRHDVMRQLDASIGSTEELLQQTRDRKLAEYAATARTQVLGTYEGTRYALLAARQSLARAEAGQKDEDRALNEYTALREEIGLVQQREAHLSDHVANLQALIKNKSGVTIRPAQFPIDPRERSTPNLIMLPVMILLALFASVGLSVGLELLNTSIRTTRDIASHLDIPLLGMVPDLDDEEVEIKHVELASSEAPQSIVAEAFRQIRTKLQFSSTAGKQRTVAITSPGPADGKTTVACNLAIALAQSGRRVLLIDANLRRPAIAEHFSGLPSSGLSNILVGQAKLEECVHSPASADLPNLDVLGSGPIAPNPAELLAGESFGKLLAEMAQRYDQIIIDTPPVLLVSDAAAVGHVVDGMVMVVRANASTRGAARRACSALQDVNAHLFGAVLNAARVTRGGYFKEQLKSYYDYQPQTRGKG